MIAHLCWLCRNAQVPFWRRLAGGSLCTACAHRITREVRAERARRRLQR